MSHFSGFLLSNVVQEVNTLLATQTPKGWGAQQEIRCSCWSWLTFCILAMAGDDISTWSSGSQTGGGVEEV